MLLFTVFDGIFSVLFRITFCLIFDSSFLFSTNNLPVSGLYLWHQLRIALECGSISWTHLSKIKSGCDEGFSANPLEIGNTGLESL